MRQFRVTFFFLAVTLALSGCGIFGGSDATGVTVADDIVAEPTVNNVQAVPAETAASTADDAAGQQPDDQAGSADAALPTAVTLPTAPPTPEPTVDRSQPTTYIVQSGDVLGLIAERFDADIAELRRVNDLDGNLIRVGQDLIIPALDGSTTSDDDAAADSASDPAPASPTSAPASAVSCSSGTGHCIQPGESLLGIALKYDVSVEDLRAANPDISGDLIRSGQSLNLPGGTSDPAPVATVDAGTPASTAGPTPTVGAVDDASCKAKNSDFPYFHAADGLCYANPIGATVVPTAVGASDVTCPAGRFLWDDGLCYNIPGVTVTPTVGPTPTTGALPDYGTAPCRDGYLPLDSGRCWPEPQTTPATVVPAAAATATATAAETVACEEPNFVLGGTGTCFVSVAGDALGCTVEDNVAKCP